MSTNAKRRSVRRADLRPGDQVVVSKGDVRRVQKVETIGGHTTIDWVPEDVPIGKALWTVGKSDSTMRVESGAAPEPEPERAKPRRSRRVAAAEILAVVREEREKVLRRDRRALLRIEARGRHLVQVIDREAASLERRIRLAREAGETPRPSWEHRVLRLEDLRLQVKQEVAAFSSYASQEVRDAAAQAYAMGQRGAGRAVQTAAGTVSGEVVVATYAGAAVQGIAAVSAPGRPVGRIFAEFGETTAAQLGDQLMRGLALGEGPRQVADRMRRVAADLPRRRALTIARTEILRAYRGASVETYAQTPEVSGWVWVAGLDSRTCGSCYALHGTEWPDGTEMESHPNCRCVPAPLVPGAPRLVEPGAESLARMDEAALARRFGPGKAAALAEGRIVPADLIGLRRSPVWGTTRTEATLTGALANAQRRAIRR